MSFQSDLSFLDATEDKQNPEIEKEQRAEKYNEDEQTAAAGQEEVGREKRKEKDESSDEDDDNDDEVTTSEQESGSELSVHSQVISCDDTNSLEVRVDGMTRHRLKDADFTKEAASWVTNYSKPLIHVSLITEDERGNVSIENHDVFGDKEVTCEIEGSTGDALKPVLASTSASTSCDESSEMDERDEDIDELMSDKPTIFKLTRNTCKEPVVKMARRRGIIRNISESDDEEEQFNHVMSLLGAHMEPVKSDVEKCGQFLTAISLETEGHTDIEQMSDEE